MFVGLYLMLMSHSIRDPRFKAFVFNAVILGSNYRGV